MSHTLSIPASIGVSGLTLLASLVDTSGTLHATLRNLACTEMGTSGSYRFSSASIPDDYRGQILFHTITASALSDFTASNTYAAAGVNPEESEYADTKVSTRLAPAGTLARVTLIDTLTTYTGNTPQTGDSFARLGSAGSGLTSLGDARLANLDAAITSRMATYTQPTGFLAGDFTRLDAAITSRMATYAQPTGFLAATFPSGTVANTTNITAGTIATVTTLTNLPAITTDWLTADGVSAAAVTKIQSGLSTYAGGAVSSVTGNIGGNLNGNVIGTVPNSAGITTILADYARRTGDYSTYAGGDTGGTTTLLSRLSSIRAGYLDNLSAGAVMLASSYTAPLTAAGTRSAVGLASANLDTQFAAIPAAPSVGVISAAVVDQTLSGHTTAGTVGGALSAAGSAADPLANDVPGTYDAGTAGYALGSIDAIKAKTDLITLGKVTITSPVNSDGSSITIWRGADYYLSDGDSLPFEIANATYSLVGATVKLSIEGRDDITGVVTDATHVYFELTNTLTASLTGGGGPGGGKWNFVINVTLSNTHKKAPWYGVLLVKP